MLVMVTQPVLAVSFLGLVMPIVSNNGMNRAGSHPRARYNSSSLAPALRTKLGNARVMSLYRTQQKLPLEMMSCARNWSVGMFSGLLLQMKSC
jgi:hypothetical protein